MAATEKELRRGIRTRDSFLATVAGKLDARVEAIARSRSGPARRRAIEELQGFVRELRLIAEPERPIAPRLQRVNLGSLLLGILGRRPAPSRAIAFEPPERPIVGRWDRMLLEAIVMELVSNALKYRGGHPVRIRAYIRGGNAEILVANAGTWSGVTGRVERFRREETRARVQGFGVGVWLARRLVKAHGGRLRYVNRNGETHAVVSLPQQHPSAANGGHTSRARKPRSPRGLS